MNPFRQIREGVQTALLELQAADGIRWVDIYDGEDWRDDEFEQIRHRVGLYGSGVYVRIFRSQLDEDAPMSTDHHDVYVQCLVAAGVVADKARAGEQAEEVAWMCYAALRGTSTGASCLQINWRFHGYIVEHQSGNCTIVSVILRNAVDFGYWTE